MNWQVARHGDGTYRFVFAVELAAVDVGATLEVRF